MKFKFADALSLLTGITILLDLVNKSNGFQQSCVTARHSVGGDHLHPPTETQVTNTGNVQK